MRRFLTGFLCVILALGMAFSAAAEPVRGAVRFSEDGQEQLGQPLAGLKIGIDPGHQTHANTEREAIAPDSRETKAKVASGTAGVNTRTPEYVVDLQVSLILRDILTAMGAEVKMTREENDVDISNIERAVMMNEWGADMVLRIHCNGSIDRSVKGAGMYVRKTGAMAEESAQLARCLLAAVGEYAGAQTQSVYKRDTYTGLNWSEVPCVLVELGYLSNAEEDALLNDAAYQEKLALALVWGMIDYVNTPEFSVSRQQPAGDDTDVG